MKILHTGDWHLGKIVHGTHMTKDQAYVLDQLLALVEEEAPDLVIVAGDIYDRSVPPTEAVELLDATLSKLVLELKTKVIMIAGNHDSPDRLGFASKILEDQGLMIRGNLEAGLKPIVVEDEHGPVNFYALPYVEPAVARAVLGRKEIKDHDSALKVMMDIIEADFDPNARNVCIGHGFVTGTESIEASDSVRRLSIGGSDYVDVSYFDAFDYTALGHLHRPQKVKSDKVRYAGSLLKYSFSEALQQKSVTLVELDEAGQVGIRQQAFSPRHDLRVIKGDLEKLLDPAVYSCADPNDYIMAVLTDRGELIDPIGKLRAVYPNILRLQKEVFDREAGADQTAASHKFIEKNPLDLFEEFYENASGIAFSEEKRNEMAGIFDGIEKEGRHA